MTVILLNPLANNKMGAAEKTQLQEIFKGKELKFEDITKIGNAGDFCSRLNEDDTLVVAGGDGTLSNFANDVHGRLLPEHVYFYPCGSGNDFLNDIKTENLLRNISIKEYIKSLPVVHVNGITKYFINGIGFGIDGYCCEEGDRLRNVSTKPVNYTKIAIGGLLGKYHPVNAKVTVDGVTREYKRVWLAPAMLGRYYGGGMKIAPDQDRFNKDKTLSSVVCHNCGKLKILSIFPKIFKGEHVSHTDIIDIRTGHEIKVEFDRPTALQIDGETVSNVTEYTATYGI